MLVTRNPDTLLCVGEAVGVFATGGIALFLSGDVVAAHSVICTHQGCTVGEAGKNLACPCHGSLYNGQSGDVINGPAQKALTTYKVAQVSNEIYIVS